jgi:hypothetical protein
VIPVVKMAKNSLQFHWPKIDRNVREHAVSLRSTHTFDVKDRLFLPKRGRSIPLHIEISEFAVVKTVHKWISRHLFLPPGLARSSGRHCSGRKFVLVMNMTGGMLSGLRPGREI